MSTYSIAQATEQLSLLVDQALAGEQVTITRDGKPVVELRASSPAGRPVTAEDIEWLRQCRAGQKQLTIDSVTLVREERDDFT